MHGPFQGPATDIVRLVLLVLFFGMQLRYHPRGYVRFWFVGWSLVLLSYAVWAVIAVPPALFILQRVVSFDFMLLGVLSFLLALLATEQYLRKAVLGGVGIGVATVLLINATRFVAVPKPWLVLMIVLWQADGVYVAHRVLPKSWVVRRRLIFAICVVYGIALLVYVGMTRADNLDTWAVGEVLLCTAVLYQNWAGRRSLARWMGTIGFVGWAAFYFANTMVDNSPGAQRVLDEFWNFPKYFVAFTMILKVFESATDNQALLAEKFRQLSEDFRLIYDTHPHPMWICDGETGKFLTANVAAIEEYGYDMEELQEMRLADLESPVAAGAEDTDSLLESPAEGERIQHRYKNGGVVWVNREDREIVYQGRDARFVVAHDITEQLKLDQELSHRAQHDALTGLPNRHLLADRLDQCLKACERENRKAAILTIDVDHFKLINDTYGHLVGDECLQQVAARLKSKIRKVDTLARTGGEEFMAVVSGLSCVSDAEKVAASLLRVFDLPLELGIGDVGMTVSIGVAVYPDDAMDVETLRRLSDEALYRAKHQGRNRAAYAFEVRARRYAL